MRSTAAIVLFLSTLVACGGNPPQEAKSADDTVRTAKKTDTKTNSDATKKDEVAVGTDVRQACGIKEVKAASVVAQQPKFDFDSYDLTSDEKLVLDQIADCLVRGPLKGKSVTLVGHADSRGEGEYNFALGAYRASAVKSYLGGKGVEQARMKETSRGALDAVGSDEPGWRDDRRVDITLAN